MGHLLGYARVSTLEQNPDHQVDELNRAGCYEVYTDYASGRLGERPKLDQILHDLRPGDTLVVWRPDRLGRSMKHLIEVVGQLGERGVGFRSLPESIDTTTPAGRLLFGIVAGLAAFEADLIRERTMPGLSAARARGRLGGRPPKMSPDKLQVAREMYESKQHTLEAIAKTIGVSRTTLCRHLYAQSTSCAA